MRYIILALFFVSGLMNAQTIRFIYKVSSITESGKLIENYHLDIDENSNSAIYYNRAYFELDSIYNKTGEFGFSDFKMTDFVKQNFVNSTFNSEIKMLNRDVFNLPIEKTKNWKIQEETREIEGKVHQKAILTYGGRNWIAWFDKNSPINAGPYVFGNLPGLIVELNDDKNFFQFELIDVQKFSETQKIDFLTTLEKNAIKISLEKYKQLMIQFYQNPFGDMMKGIENSNQPIRLDDGTLLTKQNLKESEEVIRKRLMRQNPIILDYKINYPKK